METAKELAFKAFCHNNVDLMSGNPADREERMKIQFENWWSRNYGNAYQPEFNSEHSVFIDNNRYIKAE
jgi:hypothetical protein